MQISQQVCYLCHQERYQHKNDRDVAELFSHSVSISYHTNYRTVLLLPCWDYVERLRSQSSINDETQINTKIAAGAVAYDVDLWTHGEIDFTVGSEVYVVGYWGIGIITGTNCQPHGSHLMSLYYDIYALVLNGTVSIPVNSNHNSDFYCRFHLNPSEMKNSRELERYVFIVNLFAHQSKIWFGVTFKVQASLFMVPICQNHCLNYITYLRTTAWGLIK